MLISQILKEKDTHGVHTVAPGTKVGDAANLLSSKPLAPEFIQEDCAPGKLAPAVLDFFSNSEQVAEIQAEYARVHRQLRTNTDALAADAVIALLRERGLAV